MNTDITPKALRKPENAKKIIQDNIYTLYHLNDKKYMYLTLMLKDIKKELLQILHFLENIDPIIYKQAYVWYLDNNALTKKIRKKTTKDTSNKHLNYLCALGVIRKRIDGAEVGINREFMLETDRKNHMNIITVYRYTEKQLDQIEQRAKQLHDNRVTQGNISFNKLMANNCENLAHEIYYRNSDKSIRKKDKEYSKLIEKIEKLINEKGYTTKADVYKATDLSDKEINKLFVIYKSRLWQQYTYKPPTRHDTQTFKLKNRKWIIKRK